MFPQHTALGDLLVEKNYLSEGELHHSVNLAQDRGDSLVSILLEEGHLTPDVYDDLMTEHYGLPEYNLELNPPDPHIVGMLPAEITKKYGMIVVDYSAVSTTIAVSDPTIPQLEQVIRINLGRHEPVYLSETKEEAIAPSRWFPTSLPFSWRKESDDKRGYIGPIHYVYAPKHAILHSLDRYHMPDVVSHKTKVHGSGHAQTTAPGMLDGLLRYAVELRSSDIHLEPHGKAVIVRFRIDGIMREVGRLMPEHYEGILNRIKIESGMRIDEHFVAQDGCMHYKIGKTITDIRVSTIPIMDGEKVVMRIFSDRTRSLTLNDLGFSKENQQLLEGMAHTPHGMILATGPTGSGKSTTLYSLLKYRNNSSVNISTIEDPVEYQISGVNHMQVHEKIGLTFAKGLRALVRQDPDIILVGEVRDGETAQVAVNAALTGHLLFSTLHSNDAATAIPRLLEMNVEPFLLASTLKLVIGQRLIRRICPDCRYSYTILKPDLEIMLPFTTQMTTIQPAETFYKGKGCASCDHTGYLGRLGVHELLHITPEIEQLIVTRATTADINIAARKQGMKTFFHDALEKAQEGLTSIEEIRALQLGPLPKTIAAPVQKKWRASDSSKDMAEWLIREAAKNTER